VVELSMLDEGEHDEDNRRIAGYDRNRYLHSCSPDKYI